MASKALTYAEEALGVHTVYEQAKTSRNELDNIFTMLAEKRDERRDLEYRLADAELEVITAERGKHPDMAVTRWEKHVKEVFQGDDTIRELREQLSGITSNIEGLEYDKAVAETDIRIAVARMHELGGYFEYLAETKRAARTPTTPATPEEQKA